MAAENGLGYFDEYRLFNVLSVDNFKNDIGHIYKDYQGILWFTSTRFGLLSLEESSFQDLFGISNITPSCVNTVMKKDGNLFIGTEEGLNIIDSKTFSSVNSSIVQRFSNTKIRCIYEATNGNLWICTYGEGVFEITDDNFYQYSQLDEKVRMAYEMSDGTIVVSGENKLSFIKDHKEVRSIKLDNHFTESLVLCMLEYDDNVIMAGTNGDGIIVLEDGEVIRRITENEGLSSGIILKIVKDKFKKGYFVITGSGLCFMDRQFRVHEINDFPYFNNYDLCQMDNGEIFILGGAGIFVIRYEDLLFGGHHDYTLLDKKSGLPGSITSNAFNYVDENGILYFCGTNGLYSLDTLNYEMPDTRFKSKITKYKLDDVETYLSNHGKINVLRGNKKLELVLELNNFSNADPYISYCLSGVDEQKNIVRYSELGSIVYYNIPYGIHEFQIEILSEDNKVVGKNVYQIEKEREVYETPSFQLYFSIVSSLFLIFVVISIIQLVVLRITRRQKSEYDSIVSNLEKEKAEALEKALQKEESANHMKSMFLAKMSHEIRTPINAIIGMDTMIIRETNQDQIRNYAENIQYASNTLLSLINDILDFSKIESGKLELILGEYELSQIIRELVDMIKPKAESKGLFFNIQINPAIPNHLYGDEVRIKQIILNILNNAVKYTEEGQVTLEISHEQINDQKIALIVSVADTGIGMKQEDLSKLFTPYERLEEQRNKMIEGTGLGMSITKNLLEKMNSTLKVSSEYGKGSVFSFSIEQAMMDDEIIGDYQKNVSKRSISINDQESFRAKDADILIVDDVEMNLIVAKGLLKRIQANIDTTLSGEEAVRMAYAKQYDIIFLDAMMPKMSGIEVLQEIRRNSELNRGTPTIVLTANAIKGAKEEYLRQGFDNYLSKPIDGLELERIILEYLPGEKVTYVDSKAEEHPVKKEAKKTYEIIGEIVGISLKAGLEAAGGSEVYEEVCKIFYETAKNRIAMIEEYFEKGDIMNYTIQVHALKSSARLIGALEFSELAFSLEIAGKENNVELIELKTKELLAEYKRFASDIEEIYENGTDTNKPAISKEELIQGLSEISELLEAFDYDTANMLVESLHDYFLPKDFKDYYKKIKGCMAEVDTIGVIELIKEYNNK